MNLALFAQSKVFATLQGLIRWLVSAKTTRPYPVAQFQPIRPAVTPKFIASHAVQIRACDRNTIEHKPLRVVRVLEVGQTRHSVGRMVISGRMADVCAELDRLAARETAFL